MQHWTTKALREEFAKNLGLNILLDAEVSKLRDTIRTGLQNGSWDMKVGEKMFIKTDEGNLNLPDTIEFSERMVLYRRGILELPKPREIQLSTQLMNSTDSIKPVKVRWKASGALKIALYQNGELIAGEFRPSDEYEAQVDKTTNFKIVADYGNGEIVEKESQTTIYGTNTQPTPTSNENGTNSWNNLDLFKAKPAEFNLEGTPNVVFNQLGDRIHDDKITGIEFIAISVDQVMDYRKLMTALPLLMKFPIEIDQLATIRAGEQFVRLEYQGAVKGFQSFQAAINALLNSQDVQADVMLKIEIKFSAPVQPEGSEISNIKNALNRNPVDRLNLAVKVVY